MKERKNSPHIHVAPLGKMEAHISEAGSKWSESAIRVNFKSDSDWLLTPQFSGVDKVPSTADKVLAIIKRGLLETGMDIIEDRPPDMGLGYGAGGRFKQLQTDTFHSFHSGDDGVLIRAARGGYQGQGEFNSATIATEANKIVDRLSHMMRDTRGAEDTAELIDTLYMRMELNRQPIDELLPEAAHTQVEKRAELVTAIREHLPSQFFDDEKKRLEAANQIAAGILGDAEHPAWKRAKNENLQGNEDDPLRLKVVMALDKYVKPDTALPLRGFLAGEACDAAYQVLGRHGGSLGA